MTPLAWLVGMGVAGAGELELEVARGRLSFELERFGEARDRALAVLHRDPGHAEAWVLYTDASTAAGYGSVATAEMRGTPAPMPWQPTVDALANGLETIATKELKVAVADLRARFHDEPDLLAPLWTTERPNVVAVRTKALVALQKEVPTANEEFLLRSRLLGESLGDDAASRTFLQVVDAALAAKGIRVPERPLLSRPELRLLAEQWSVTPVERPFLYPSEVPVTGSFLEEIWTKAARWDDIVTFWATVEGQTSDPRAALGRSHAHLAANRVEQALAAADDAWSDATAPREIDRLALGDERIRRELATVLLQRALVDEKRGEAVQARGELGTAFVLAEAALDGPFADRLSSVAPIYESQLESAYRATRTETSAQVALRLAGAAAQDPASAEAVIGMARGARFLAMSGTGSGTILEEDPDLFAGLFGDTWFLEGRAHATLGHDVDARNALVLASILLPEDAEVLAARGAAHEKLTERDAAFASYARARGKGFPDLDTKLGQLYNGPGDWKAVAVAIGGEPPPPPPTPVAAAPKKPRGANGGSVVKRASTGGGALRPTPKLNAPFPSLTFPEFSTESLRGRIVVFSTFRSDCEECLQMLPSFARLARRLRATGVNLVVVGISLDEDAAAYAETEVMAKHWGLVANDPSAGPKLGVRRVPTTWVLDSTGVTRHFVDHWISSQDLEEMVLQTH